MKMTYEDGRTSGVLGASPPDDFSRHVERLSSFMMA
jgi:hypothetical protein